MLTIALILADYAGRTGQSGGIASVASSPGFVDYLQALEKRLTYNTAVEKGSSALVASFVEDASRYDFITAYESAALEEVTKNPKLAVIYPDPTASSENAVAILSADWVSPAQKTTAQAFLNFLNAKPAVSDGLRYHFRPGQSGGLSLSPELSRYAGQGFRQSFSTIELPPYSALNEAAFAWRIHIAHKPAE